MKNRKDLRVHCSIIIKMMKRIVNNNEVIVGDEFDAEVTNISAAGIHFITSRKIEEHREYIIEMPVNQTIEKILCKVLRVYFVDERYNCAAKFEKMSYMTEKNIRAYVYKVQLTEGNKSKH